MSSQGISDCCVTGHLHEGGPTGAVTEIVGLKTYIAEPEGGSKDKSVIFITDIFGYQLPVSSELQQFLSVECSTTSRRVCQSWILRLRP